MMKKLLFALFAVLCSTGVFAHEAGDYVYTSTQRFMLTGANLLTNGNFDDASYAGWTNVEGGTIDAEAWSLEDGMGPDGGRAVISQGADKNGSLCQTLAVEPGQTYVVSFWVKGETLANTTTMQAFVNLGDGLTKVTNPGVFAPVDVITSLNYGSEWREVAGVVVVSDTLVSEAHEGIPTLVINLTALPTNVQVANFSVNTATQVFDIRGIQSQVAFAKTLMDDANFNVPAAEAARAQLAETIETIEGMIAAGELDDMDAGAGAVTGFEEQFEEFLSGSSTNMSSLIPGLDIASLSGWGRGGAYSANYMLDLWGGNWGHLTDDDTKYELRSAIQNGYAHTATYNAYHADFPAGKYFFTCEIRNANTGRASWPTEPVFNLEMDGCKMFIATDTIDLPTIAGEEYQRFYMIGEVKEDGAFRAGVYWPGVSSGGAFFIKSTMVRAFDFDIPAKVDHVQAWKKFIAQWNAAVNARNNADEKLRDSNYPWENQVLRDAMEKYDPYYFAQKAKGWVSEDGKDAGVATTDELNEWALYQGIEEYSTNEETGEQTRLEYQLVRGYQNATNAVVAANKPITDLAEAIDAAKKERNKGANATGDRDGYKAAIEKALATLTQIRTTTTDATREADAATLAEALAELLAANEAFLASIQNTPVVDIDFTGAAFVETETGYVINGNAGQMEFTAGTVVIDIDAEEDSQACLWSIGYKGEYPDVLRVGSAAATINIPDVTDNDAVRITFDMWLGYLNKCQTTIDVQNAAGESLGKIIRWNSQGTSESSFGLTADQINTYMTTRGSSSVSNGAIIDNSNKSSIELYFDYQSGKKQANFVHGKAGAFEGPVTEIEMPASGDNKVAKLVISSNYNSQKASQRRSWMDDLKIWKSTARADFEEDITQSAWGEIAVPDGIENVTTVKVNNNAIYNLMGVRVNKAQKGLYIINGKKYVVK